MGHERTGLEFWRGEQTDAMVASLTKQSLELGKSAFLLRTHLREDHPSEFTVERMASMIKDLQKADDMEVFLSIDMSRNGDTSRLKEVLAKAKVIVEGTKAFLINWLIFCIRAK